MVVADTVVSLGVFASFYALLALGMNIKYGHTGLLDFGHVGFYLIGAYTAALFVLPPDAGGAGTVYVIGLNLPWVVAAAAAMLVAGIVGAFVALPTLRLREDYLAITVLGVSAIFQRIVQAESWLVNGPDALRGIVPPLKDLFPVGSGSVVGAIVVALVGGAIWAASAWVLGRALETDRAGDAGAASARTDGSGGRERATLAGRIHAVATLGIDRLIGDDTERESRLPGFGVGSGRDRYVGSALLAGAVAGIVGGVVTFAVPNGLLIWGTVVSVLTWLALLVGLARYAADFDAIDYGVTFVLGTGYLLALAPMFFLDALVVWIPLTLLAFAVVIGVTLYLEANWSRFASRPFRYGTFVGLWFVALWYFPLQVLSSLGAGDLMGAATTLFNNTVWMLSFSGTEPLIGYSRFQLFLFGTIALLAVFVLDLIVDSPFGRVLRAIRNDERVVNSLGKDPFMYKLQSMAIGSALAGLAGALAALYYQTLVFTMFAPRVTFIALLMMFLGGVGNNRAMIVGGLLYWAFETATTELAGFVAPGIRENLQAFRFVIMGVLFLVLLYYRPEGLLGERAKAGVGE